MPLKKIPGISIKVFCIIICVNILFVNRGILQVFANDQEPKQVLILNSYQCGLSWTDHEVDGIISTLNKSDVNCSIAVEYLDWKNYPTEENVKIIYKSLSYKYSQKHIDLIITTDDVALDFSLKYRKELFADAPVVFCGVNETGVKKLTAGSTRVTGVVEEVDAERTVKAALQINPSLKEIYVVYDNTESGISTGEMTIQVVHQLAPQVKVTALHQGKFDDILNQVKKASKDSAILITTYYMDGTGAVIGFENSCEQISLYSKVPIFHLYEFGIDHGAIGGSMLFGELQGQSAAKIAIRILQGEDISTIAIKRDVTTRYVFDYQVLNKYNIPLKRIPRDSQILHKPFSFIETYKNLVITVLIIFLLLITFIFILLYYLKKISRMRQKLYDNNLELTHLYDDLAASDEELKQQFDELTITQRNLMASEERYALLFNRMLNGFFVFEPVVNQNDQMIDLRFITVNPSFEYHTTRKANRIIGKTWTEVFGTLNSDLLRMAKVLQTGAAERFETYYPEEKSYYLMNAFRIDQNQVGVVVDNITDYKSAIEEIGKLNEELEQRVIDRTFELQNAITELEAFAYTVSHDLKSPLRAVDGYSKIILEDYEQELNGEVVSTLSVIRGICSEMIDMINKLLQYSTTTKIILHSENIEMRELIEVIYHELISTEPMRRIELRIETGLPNVLADRVLLRQAITNIISNAIKFTKNRVDAVISVGATITEKEYVFYIRDNGVGFDMKYVQKLYNIFQRLHTSDEFEGSGIGLVTVKKIIEKHSGRTWIEGKAGIGATVYFTLPIQWKQDENQR